ncbi:hypothetical protein QN277_007003 [Acacia crassicarpa]|uniref:F-box domain-containing protein n=1 Tax=Acacia crassicarpa TaxID=499986 RepID=A0AAE1M9F1_9FABA|nr:hypothetical protein QN277_007003 [Acacia crassicarpa]
MNNLVLSPDSSKRYRHDVIDKKDVISELPDSLLHHILSFLSTRDAIRTSLLARRWKFLWTYLSDFNIKLEDRQKQIIHLFNQVDTILDKAKFIRRFSLVAFEDVNVDKVYYWIIILLLKHKIQELELSLDLRSPFLLANYSTVLKSLNVMNLELPCVLEVAGCVHFPCLKTLALHFITFVDETSAQQLFSGCPVLQKLTLDNCGWKNVQNVSIKIPTLTTLIIEDESDSILNCKVTIDAVNLRSLSYNYNFIIELIPVGLTSLADAYIDVSTIHPSLEQYTIPRAIRLFGGILHVKSLVLSKDALSTLSHAENLLSRLPTFHNLTHLGVDQEMYDFTGEALMDILEKSPKLEVLDIVDGFDQYFCSNGEVWTLRPAPHCIKYSLKFVRITDFWGRVAEMQFLMFLLKNATILRRIKIFCGESLSADLEKQAEINNQLQATRKGLPSCAIEFR